MFCFFAAWMTKATVFCMRGSRPKPGPMTRTWRRERRGMILEAISEGSVSCLLAVEGSLSSPAGLAGEEGRERIRGWTIRLGE